MERIFRNSPSAAVKSAYTVHRHLAEPYTSKGDGEVRYREDNTARSLGEP